MTELEQASPTASAELAELTAEVAAAYVGRNALPPTELPGLIASVHEALAALTRPAAPEKPVPPVPVKKTITPDYLISLEDGRQYRTLRRHLTSRGLTPEAYRAKWGLPSDYPMTAASYREQRSELARSLGLGQARARKASGEKMSGERTSGETAKGGRGKRGGAGG